MKDFERLSEVAFAATQIFLPNRYPQVFVDNYQSLTGLEVPLPTARKNTTKSRGRSFSWVRGRDIPASVAQLGLCQPETLAVGLTGSEWCEEFDSGNNALKTDWAVSSDQRLGRLALIKPPSMELSDLELLIRLRGIEVRVGGELMDFDQEPPLQVITPYPNLTSRLSDQRRYGIVPLFPVSGGVEAQAEAFQLPGIDLVVEGTTVRENQCQIIQELMDVYPAVVCKEDSL